MYGVILNLASFVDPKAKKLVQGRKQTLKIIESKKAEYPNTKWIWVHAASLGEFEQGRHLINRISAEYPEYKIALSFYSPSGYEPRQNYKIADLVVYMPLDTKQKAIEFINTLSPHLAIFIKYDFWWNHLNELQSKAIPTIFISAEIRPNQYFIKNKLGGIRSILTKIDHFYLQTQRSADLLNSIGISSTTVTGDSRLDSIINEEKLALPIQKEIETWKSGQKCIIYGSVHLSDINAIKQMLNIEAKHLIVPHDVDLINISSIQSHLPNAVKYSELGFNNSSVVILDQIGVLRHLYYTADLVYIGGGFGKGIHNTLEPLVQLVPIIIGPSYSKFPEAIELISVDAIRTIHTANIAFEEAEQMLMSSNHLRKMAQRQYIRTHSGATAHIIVSLANNNWI